MIIYIDRDAVRKDVITYDMGGTTAKLGAIDNGTPAIMPTFEVDLVRARRGSGLPLNVPAVEMQEIGAGGGSIARVEKGMITVGPDSAGATPGPISLMLLRARERDRPTTGRHGTHINSPHRQPAACRRLWP